jgi:hypothetical protein
MAFYYEKIQVKVVDELTSNAGKIGHILRNFCQGYVNVNFPEILSLDNISGQIEGQCRTIRGNLKLGTDIKPTILTCARLTRFIKKIVTEDFFKNSSFDPNKLNHIRKWVDEMQSHFEKIDELVNIAILEVSKELFQDGFIAKSAEFPKEFEKPGKEILNEFEYEKNFDEKIVDFEKSLELYKSTLGCLGGLISNISHSIQDEVSENIQTASLNEVANKIIALAGDIENQGRAIVAESVANRPNVTNINKYCDNSNNQVNAMKDFVKGKDYPKEKIDKVLANAGLIQTRIVESVRKVIQKGFKII